MPRFVDKITSLINRNPSEPSDRHESEEFYRALSHIVCVRLIEELKRIRIAGGFSSDIKKGKMIVTFHARPKDSEARHANDDEVTLQSALIEVTGRIDTPLRSQPTPTAGIQEVAFEIDLESQDLHERMKPYLRTLPDPLSRTIVEEGIAKRKEQVHGQSQAQDQGHVQKQKQKKSRQRNVPYHDIKNVFRGQDPPRGR